MIHRLVYSLFITGLIATAAGFLGLFYPSISLVLILPLYYLVKGIYHGYKTILLTTTINRWLLLLLTCWWLLHAIKVFVPETGFDALWYHLPVAHQVITNHRFGISSELYQSFNPLFADSIFFLGYQIAGDFGAKAVAYVFGLSLVVVSYWLSRKFLNQTLSLAAIAVISSFQVVSWQSSSFYIDLAKATFEIAALSFLLEKQHIKSMLILGASAASKLFSLALIPLFILLTKKPIYLVSLVIALPFYLLSYLATGDPIYSITYNGQSLLTWDHFITQAVNLPSILIKIGVTRDYTTPLLLLLVPLVLKHRQHLEKIKPLLVFGVYQILLWWFLPPLSTRYALSGFIALTIAAVYLLRATISAKQTVSILIIFALLPLPIRAIAVVKTIPYLTQSQTKMEYLQNHLDGTIDHHLIKWHRLPLQVPE
jgi:hypothetical protein